MLRKGFISFTTILLLFLLLGLVVGDEEASVGGQGQGQGGRMVKRDQRKVVVSTEYGQISAVKVWDGSPTGHYHLHFITLEPNALLLPSLLHQDMIFYVKTGSGKLSWIDSENDETKQVNLERGDVYRLQPGTVFYIQSNLETQRQKLRIHAIFTISPEELHETSSVPYSSIRDLVLGFDAKVLQAAFKASEQVIAELKSGRKQPAIIHAPSLTKEKNFWELEAIMMKGLTGIDVNKKKKKHKTETFNIFNADPDFKNCNGRSLTVTRKNLNALKGSQIGLFMVELTKGSMMGPHWNPVASEIAIVAEGRGMIRVVCSSTKQGGECQNKRFYVEEGDVFVVPRFHPMAQMSFNNDSFVFVGFSTSAEKNHPQYLAGKASVFQTLDKQVVAATFNVSNTTVSQILAPQADSIILDCTSCAEEEEIALEQEIEKAKEEARKKEEEEASKRAEEKRREEEEARKKEEEEARKREEEKRKREEEAEEEARKRKEEEEERKSEEEAARKREQQEEERKREEEAAARKRQEEEEAAREEERKREEEEAARRQEEEAAKRQEEEAAKRTEEEEERKREEEAAREEEREREEEEAARRQEEEAARRQEEEAARRTEEEEERKREEEAAAEEEAARRQEEEEEGRREEEAAAEEEAARRQEEEARREAEEEEERGGGSGGGGWNSEKPRIVLRKIWRI